VQTISSGTPLDSLLACRVSRKEMSVLTKRALCKEFLAFYVTVTKLALKQICPHPCAKIFDRLAFL
jgi:hypothetical protein